MEQVIDKKRDVQPIPVNDAKLYDFDRCYYRVYLYMQRYRRVRNKSFLQDPINLTPNYEFVYVDTPMTSSNSYSLLDSIIDCEKEYIEKSKIISLIVRKLTFEERVYFTICLFDGNSEASACREISCSPNGLKSIQRSCIIKVACALDIEVLKGELMDSEDEENYHIFKDIKKR